jgi:hypothetical protein
VNVPEGYGTLLKRAGLLAALAGSPGCALPDDAERSRLIVSTATSGVDRDLDGYHVEIQPRPGTLQIGDNETLLIESLPAGRYVVTLSGVAGRCRVEGEPSRHASLPPGGAATVDFSISCPSAVVALDAGHNNYHTAEGRYSPFAELLRREGYLVESVTGLFAPSLLSGIGVLVISNALHERNVENWSLPTPSAFTEAEIAAVVDWVSGGGGLLLIADHMPFPGAAAELAAAFGVEMSNGFAYDTTRVSLPRPCLSAFEIDIFSRARGGLADHPITAGRIAAERVDSVATFTGHAFTASGAQPLLTLGSAWHSFLPERAWAFTEITQRVHHGGWLQGAVLRWGGGRVAIFGEAGMFTEQTCGGAQPMGMNAPQASQNGQFALNVLHWLAGYLERD